MAHQASTAGGRALFTVAPHGSGWAVEFEGETFDAGGSKQDAIAAAHRRARACHDGGRAAQVAVHGEISFADRAGLVKAARA